MSSVRFAGFPSQVLAVALASCTLAGCTALPVPPLPDTVPAAWRHSTGAEAALGAAGAPAAPLVPLDPKRWWQAFGDGALDRLVDAALAQNLTLAQARSRLRQARFLASRDERHFRPQLSASARTLQDVSATDSYFQASLDAVWELGLFGARESAERAGQAGLQAAVAGEQGARVSVVAEVVRNYHELRAAQRQLGLLERTAELDRRAVDLLDIQQSHRLGSSDDRLRAQARWLQTRAQISDPRQGIERAAQSLAVLLGRSSSDDVWAVLQAAPVAGAPAAAAPAVFTLQQVPADLLRYRPEIRSAEAEVLKASAELGSATAELYPRLTIGASFLYSRNLTQHRRGPSDSIPVIGPLLDIPLFDWARRHAAADAHREALDAALLAYRQAVLESVAETEAALSALQQAQQRTESLRGAADALQRRVQRQARLVELRLGSRLDGMAAERSALQAALELDSAEAGRALAVVALYKSLGGAPLPADGSEP